MVTVLVGLGLSSWWLLLEPPVVLVLPFESAVWVEMLVLELVPFPSVCSLCAALLPLFEELDDVPVVVPLLVLLLFVVLEFEPLPLVLL